jgi:hypothetical protein
MKKCGECKKPLYLPWRFRFHPLCYHKRVYRRNAIRGSKIYRMKIKKVWKEGVATKVVKWTEADWKRAGCVNVEKSLGKRFGWTKPRIKYSPGKVNYS